VRRGEGRQGRQGMKGRYRGGKVPDRCMEAFFKIFREFCGVFSYS
jgi:hypothetical protein